MAEPTWEGTLPVSEANSPQGAPMPSTGETPTWESTYDPQEKYGSLGQQAIAGVEGFGKGLAGPLATAFEQSVGIDPQDIEGRAQVNPITHYGSEMLGLVAPAIATSGASALARAGVAGPEIANTVRTLGEFTQAGLLGKAGRAASEASGLSGAAGKMAVQFGVENALLGAGDELSKEIQGHPDSIQTAAMNVGLMGIIGAATGGAFGKASDLWKAKFGPQAEGFVKDFKARSQDHANGSLPAADAVGAELQSEYTATNNALRDLRESQGVGSELSSAKAEKARNETLQNLFSEAEALKSKKMVAESDQKFHSRNSYLDDPARLSANENYGKILQREQTLQEELAAATKTESKETTKAQQAINKIFDEYAPALKDFERTFTEKVGEESRISPAKVNTFVNQLGKPNAEIKVEKLANYLDANDRLYARLEKIHSDLGIDNPFERPSLTAARAVTQKITPGMKFADFIYKHSLDLGAEGASDILGALGGHSTGIPGAELIGAYISHHALKPLMKTIMPVMIKPLMQLASSASGLKASMEAVSAVIKGEALATSATKALFTSGREIIPQSLFATKKDLEKLDKKVREYNDHPMALMEMGGDVGHYLPEHSTALAQMASNAVSYLGAIRPKLSKLGPLDKELKPSIADEKAYDRTLQIASQPLTVLQHVKDGTLQMKDLQDLSTLYPAVYSKLKGKVYSAMMDHVTEGGNIPYQLRMGLSFFLGEPLDSTMSPQSIQSAQSTFLIPEESPVGPPKSGSSSKIQKLASLSETPIQSRQMQKAAK